MPSFYVRELAALVNARVQGDPETLITGVGALASAKSGELSYLAHAKYRPHLSETQACAVLVTAQNAALCTTTALIVDNPEVAYAKIALKFKKQKLFTPGIHPNAAVGVNCQIDSSVHIGAQCVIGDNVRIGANTVVQAGTVIGDDVIVGADCRIYPRVTVYDAVVIGNHVTLHSGVVIGADGFGLTQDKGQWLEIPQLGRVVIGNNVLVGANTCIDRGALNDTVIEDGVKLDNLIQIAHNVRVGAHTVVAAMSGIAGSAQVGRYCMIGGSARINSHITIADKVVLTATTFAMSSITEPGVYSSGTSTMPNRQWHRSTHYFGELDNLAKRIKQLEKVADE